jgi:hypothetical protein
LFHISSNSRRSNLHTHDGKNQTAAHIEEKMNYNLPITTTYLKRMKSLGYNNYSNDHYTSDTNRLDLHSNLIIAGSVEDQELDEVNFFAFYPTFLASNQVICHLDLLRLSIMS